MSSLSNLPYGKILDYWYEKLSGNKFRTRFILTKVIEVFSFKNSGAKNKKNYQYVEFPKSIPNEIPIKPIISIVIPAFIKTRKDVNDIKNLLTSLENQTLKPDFTILIDDCSPLTYDYSYSASFYKLEKNSGPAKARNVGKEIALQYSSDIIAFTDADCIVNENWVYSILNSFINKRDYSILSGNTISYDRHWYGQYHNINGTLNGRQINNTERLLYGTTANLAITKQVATNLNFNESFPFAAGEDIEFCFWANKKGFAIKHIPEMLVQHHYGYSKNYWNSFNRFRNLFKKYGHGEKILLQEIPEYYAYFDKTSEIPA
jgi:GT2 family glycosyltransferase